jgi:methionyl-tRNA formyltransferase
MADGGRVVVLGKGTLAIRVADWFRRSEAYELRTVVPVVPEPAWTDSFLGWSEAAGVEHVPSGDYRDLASEEGDWATDLAVSVFYDRILPDWFIRRCRRILNIHNGPLPRYRGVSPINWALKNEERLHGVTIHEITPGIDDGPIVAQALYSIYPEVDEVRDVYARALEFAWTLFEQTMPMLDRIEAAPQDDSQALYYSLADNERLGERRGFTRAESSVASSS